MMKKAGTDQAVDKGLRAVRDYSRQSGGFSDAVSPPRVYLADIWPLADPQLFAKTYKKVSAHRQRKVDACRQEKRKMASLAAGFLAEYALLQEGYEGKLTESETGKPVLEQVAGKAPLYISISHSGDYAACAVAHVPVGIDIQKILPVRTGMLRHFDATKEQPVHQTAFLSEPEALSFLRSWAVKESYMKLTGLGMAQGFSNICIDWERKLVWDSRTGAAKLQAYKAPAGYVLYGCFLEEKTA